MLGVLFMVDYGERANSRDGTRTSSGVVRVVEPVVRNDECSVESIMMAIYSKGTGLKEM